jgi:hypothetical protein
MGFGLVKPKQIFVFGSVSLLTEYSARKPRMEYLHRIRAEHQFLMRHLEFFFWGKQHTVVNGTKDRKSVFNSTSEQYIGTKGWCDSDFMLWLSVCN